MRMYQSKKTITKRKNNNRGKANGNSKKVRRKRRK